MSDSRRCPPAACATPTIVSSGHARSFGPGPRQSRSAMAIPCAACRLGQKMKQSAPLRKWAFSHGCSPPQWKGKICKMHVYRLFWRRPLWVRITTMNISIPEFALVVLIGPSGSGKSSFGRRHFKPTEVISSDFCRGLVSDDENDQSATNNAFAVLHFIAARRLAAGKLTVIDATNVLAEDRK